MKVIGEEEHLVCLSFSARNVEQWKVWDKFCVDLKAFFQPKEGIAIRFSGSAVKKVEFLFPATETAKVRQNVEEIAKKNDIEIEFIKGG